MPRREPERTCIVSRTVRPAAAMIRFVLGPDGTVVPDLKRRLPGRGVWVTAERAAIEEAARRRLFNRAFKSADATASPDLAEGIEAALRLDLRQALALANKAGAVITGFVKVEAAIADKPIAALIHALGAGADGRRKLAGALRKRVGEAISTIPAVEEFSGDELDLALGRSNVIHAALIAGVGSEGFLMRWRRLQVYRGVDASQVARAESGAHDHEPAGTEAE
jgi:predicted RNA-binding protein YlxR (DUF448 family)